MPAWVAARQTTPLTLTLREQRVLAQMARKRHISLDQLIDKLADQKPGTRAPLIAEQSDPKVIYLDKADAAFLFDLLFNCPPLTISYERRLRITKLRSSQQRVKSSIMIMELD